MSLQVVLVVHILYIREERHLVKIYIDYPPYCMYISSVCIVSMVHS